MKNEADDTKKISTSFLKKHDYFCGRQSGTITWTRNGLWGENKSSVSIEVSTLNMDNYLRIHYTQTNRETGGKKDFDYRIPLTTTPCRYGGKRYWFICPWYKNGTYCGRRVGTLYKDGDYFACRHCYELAYSSQKENRRSHYQPLFRTLETSTKIDKLKKEIKRHFYKGKPTRKYKMLEKLYTKTFTDYRKFKP